MEIPNFLSALCLPLASTAGYGPFVTSLTSWGAFTLINLICFMDYYESPSAAHVYDALVAAVYLFLQKQTLTT